MSKSRIGTSILAVALVLGVTACGGDDNGSSSATQTQTTPTVTSDAGKEPRAAKVTPAPGEGDLGTKPKVPKGKGDPPTDLIVQDLVVGKGKKAKVGDNVAVQYVGVLFDDGTEFDASWRGKRPGKPFEFPLGGGQVIPGWDRGVIGMKEGGRRKLIIPSLLAYGAQGYPPDIPPNAALIFDIDLKKIS